MEQQASSSMGDLLSGGEDIGERDCTCGRCGCWRPQCWQQFRQSARSCWMPVGAASLMLLADRADLLTPVFVPHGARMTASSEQPVHKHHAVTA